MEMAERKDRARPPIFGTMAEFTEPSQLLGAVRRARKAGFRRMEAYTPFPVEEVAEALEEKNRLPLIVFCGGCLGALCGFFMQYYTSVIGYPVVVGGKPLNSWPSFIVITFEMTVLFSALAAVLGMLALNGLPQPHHPVFNVDRFGLATQDRFFLLILAADPQFDPAATLAFLRTLEPVNACEVPL